MDGTTGSAAGATHVGPVAGGVVATTGSEAGGGAAVDCAGGGGGETSASVKVGLGGASVSTRGGTMDSTGVGEAGLCSTLGSTCGECVAGGAEGASEGARGGAIIAGS